LNHVAPGFERPEEVQTLRISIPESQVADSVAVVRMQQAIADKIAAIPGVDSVGLTSIVPMLPSGWRDAIYTDDRPDADTQLPQLRRFKFISPGLVKTIGNTIVAGRDLTWTDIYEMTPIALVSENLARELWREPAAAIGRRIREDNKGPWREIVGVVSDEREDGVDHPAPAIVFWPILTRDFNGNQTFVRRTLSYVVRSRRAGSTSLLAEVDRAVWSIDPNLPLASVRTLREIYDKSLARTSFTLVMLAMAGAMALFLGAAGIYGVISYSVSQRTREIGIRMALGARHAEVTRLFVGRGVQLTIIGVVCGLAGALAITRLLTSLLFQVSALDPLTYVLVSVGLVTAAALASYLPALRATRISPIRALKAE
jgi:predicted permease